MTAKVLLEMPEELLSAIDSRRGDVPRNAWIRRAIESHLRYPAIAPEPTPSKTPPPKEQPMKVPEPKTAASTGYVVVPELCSHPKSRRQVFGWGTLCGLCGAKL